MTTWDQFRAAEPEFADRVRRTFAVRKHATMATVRRDGAPRISGTELTFDDDGEIYVAMMPGTRRADDLRRDPRVAIHSPTDDPPGEPAAWRGEGKIAGRAVEVERDRFRLNLEQVVLTAIADGALRITSWTPARGRTEVARG